jgi:hypothetical protein
MCRVHDRFHSLIMQTRFKLLSDSFPVRNTVLLQTHLSLEEAVGRKIWVSVIAL